MSAAGEPVDGASAAKAGPRSRKGVATRARLVDAAKEVFEESGFLDARISDIAERAGLSHGSFYHYFDSKEEVFREVAAAQEERLNILSVTESGLLDTDVAVSMHDRFRESIVGYLEQYRDESRIMRVIEQVSRYDPLVLEARTARGRSYRALAAQGIAHLRELGLADPTVDPATASVALTAMVTRFAEMWFVQGELDCDFDAGVEQLTTLCLNALGVRPGEG